MFWRIHVPPGNEAALSVADRELIEARAKITLLEKRLETLTKQYGVLRDMWATAAANEEHYFEELRRKTA